MAEFKSVQFLKEHIQDILHFYHPRCIDLTDGGFFNQFKDDGTICDRSEKCLVKTCRFTYIFSLGYMVLGNSEYKKAAEHGLSFLRERHAMENGGFAWNIRDGKIEDGTRHCYGHAFVLLAAAGATKAGIENARSFLYEILFLLEANFYDPSAQLYVDVIDGSDWSKVDSYRGQNANMHMCEAMISAFEATKDQLFLDRAKTIAKRICIDLTQTTLDGFVWEHFDSEWRHDWEYNKDDPKSNFRPYGYISGHQMEWAKLLVILEYHSPESWMLPKAKSLYENTMKRYWDSEFPGIHHALSPEGEILDTDRYFWVVAEAIGASALLAIRTNDQQYWGWYGKLWSYADKWFIDHRFGAWFRILDRKNNRYSNLKSPPDKVDYHCVAACFETIHALQR